jgi:hypothetical protein
MQSQPLSSSEKFRGPRGLRQPSERLAWAHTGAIGFVQQTHVEQDKISK